MEKTSTVHYMESKEQFTHAFTVSKHSVFWFKKTLKCIFKKNAEIVFCYITLLFSTSRKNYGNFENTFSLLSRFKMWFKKHFSTSRAAGPRSGRGFENHFLNQDNREKLFKKFCNFLRKCMKTIQVMQQSIFLSFWTRLEHLSHP